MNKNALISLRGIRVDFDDEPVLKGIDLDIMDKEFITFLGPSGCGKTTTLRIIGGFIQPKEGDVFFGGVRINDLPPYKREVNTVFQRYALFPHLNVYENVEFGLKIAKVPEKERRQSVKEMLKLVGLSGYDRRHINQLSGGQQQRVALARALVVEPGVLLFDEPLSNLDAKLRVSMRTEIRRIQQEVGITAIYVTHDQSEAMALSDQIIIMNKGVVAQIGTPQEIYFHPVSEFVADFIGEANFLRGKVLALEGNTATLAIEGETAHVEATRPVSVGEEVTVVLRPESATLTEDRGLPCKVEVSCFMGSYQNYHVRVGETLVKLTEYNPKNKRIFAQGENCFVHFDANATHIL